MRKTINTLLITLIIFNLSSCKQNLEDENNLETFSEIQIVDDEEIFQENLPTDNQDIIKLYLTEESELQGSNYQFKDEKLSISNSGTFELSGTLPNGQIYINANKDSIIHLILNNLNITSINTAPIYVLKAKKVYLELTENSSNTFETIGEFQEIDENNIDGVIFSKKPLIIGGTGKLNINTNYGHGIVVKDTLDILNGIFKINVSSTGISSNEKISIENGYYEINTNTNGIQAKNNTEKSIGDIYIKDGEFIINATSDGIEAGNILQINNGQFTINTNLKGIKSLANMAILNGTYSIHSADDALHSNSNIQINDGYFEIITDDDGIHADNNLVIKNGNIYILNSYEGLEALNIQINDGEITLKSTDDGMNAAGGNDSSGNHGPFGGGGFDTEANAIIQINDGIIYIDASGDGIDSNGYIEINGGELYICGPTNSGNGALDYGLGATINGGIFIATCSRGMNSNFTSASQGSIMINVNQTSETLELLDINEQNIITFKPVKTYSSIIISTPELTVGNTYIIQSGGTQTSITLTQNIYGNGGGFGGGGKPR